MVTPLARQVINQMLVPLEKRFFIDQGLVMYRMPDIHCFEVSEIITESNRLIQDLTTAKQVSELTSFLPAPKTWIEWKNGSNGRVGFLLEDKQNYALVTPVVMSNDKFFSDRDSFGLPFQGSGEIGTILTSQTMDPAKVAMYGRIAATLIGALAFINTPKIIGRRQHMPNKGLEKKIVKDRTTPNVFPLHAWTEVILKITPPINMAEKASTEAHLTGQKALHFCRAHLRIQYGKLVVVKAHWRGDSALGIIQTRYKVTP